MPDAFTDPKRVTKSYILAANAPIIIDVPAGQNVTEYKPQIKCGRPIGSKDKNPRKRKGAKNEVGQNQNMTASEKLVIEDFPDITYMESLEDV